MSHGLTRRRSELIDGYGFEMSKIVHGESHEVDLRQLFANPEAPFELELGSGKGTFLVQEAARRTDTNFIGIEWSSPFFRFAADRMRRHNLKNTKMVHGDGSEFVSYWCADSVVSTLHLYFLDPWPKSRHHKRRVVQTKTMQHFHRILGVGGLVHLVTDHEDLWQWYLDHVEAASALFDVRAFEPPDSAGENEVVGTNFERKYRVEGRSFHAMTLVKK